MKSSTDEKLELPKTGSDRFRGDMSRNEVELDLDKFLDLLRENSELKDRLRDSESDTKINPWQKWIHFAKVVDSYRLFPRAFITVYLLLLYHSTMWFMELNDPSMSQAGLISTIVGAGAAWFGLYVRSNGDGEK